MCIDVKQLFKIDELWFVFLEDYWLAKDNSEKCHSI